VAVCPWAPQHRLLRIAVHGRELDQRSRPPLNLVFLVDTSGSMSGDNRLPLVIRSLEKLSAVLNERDRLAIVTYAGSSTVPLPAIAGDQHERIKAALRDLTAGGSTNGAGGIISAYAEAAKNVAPGTQSRVVLCTDGDFNVGTTSQDDLRRLIEQQRSTGIYLTIYGFGMGNNKDETLEMLADRGNGSYGYINDESDANRLVVGGAIGQLVTIAKDAKVQVFFNPVQVAGWRQIGYENRQLRREDFANDQIDAGEIGAGHTVTALYELVPVGVPVPALSGEANPFIPATRSDAPAAAQPGLLQVRLRWKAPDQDVSRLHEQVVDGTVGAMDADFSTAAGLAAFGMLLRQSPYKGTADWSMAETLVRNGLTRDPQRQEALSLITSAHGLAR
jgi:Ca-activated chloride channel family protein